MKAKKAIKRLAKAETLLTNVIDEYPAAKDGLRALLDSAKTSVSQARAAIDLEESAQPRKTAGGAKAVSSPKEASSRRLSDAGRKRISLAAKKRWAAARRKGVNAVTGQKLSKTA